MAMVSLGGAPEDEVLFLVVQALSSGPFAALGAQLAAQAAAQGLLPRRHDVTGALGPSVLPHPLPSALPDSSLLAPSCGAVAFPRAVPFPQAPLWPNPRPPRFPPAGAQHPLSLSELQQRYAHLPSDALHQLLSHLLERRQQEAPQPAARGLTSLLEGGALGVLSGGPAAATLPPLPAWLRPARALPSQPHRLLLLRQCGLLRSAQHPAMVVPPAEYGRQLAHQLTVRGHRYAVYCVTYDRTGRYIVTGSDDRLVKVRPAGSVRWLLRYQTTAILAAAQVHRSRPGTAAWWR